VTTGGTSGIGLVTVKLPLDYGAPVSFFGRKVFSAVLRVKTSARMRSW